MSIVCPLDTDCKSFGFPYKEKEEQLLVVQKAQQAVYEAEQRIRENELEIQQTIQNKRNEKRFQNDGIL